MEPTKSTGTMEKALAKEAVISAKTSVTPKKPLENETKPRKRKATAGKKNQKDM